MKILGIDYGRKRIGLATCGPLKIAHPLKVIQRKNIENDLQKILECIQEHDIQKIVVGLPKNMNDSCGEMAQEATKFADILKERFSLPMAMWDERLSTWEAKKRLEETGLSRNKRAKLIDAAAATLILQSYVDKNL